MLLRFDMVKQEISCPTFVR